MGGGGYNFCTLDGPLLQRLCQRFELDFEPGVERTDGSKPLACWPACLLTQTLAPHLAQAEPGQAGIVERGLHGHAPKLRKGPNRVDPQTTAAARAPAARHLPPYRQSSTFTVLARAKLPPTIFHVACVSPPSTTTLMSCVRYLRTG